MSMHIIEDVVEYAVKNIAASSADTLTKRRLIHALYRLQEYGDCAFTNLRCTRELVASRYTFLFRKSEMWDYRQRQDFYDRRLAEEGAGPQGELYLYDDYDKTWPEADGKVCVDSGSTAWEMMVADGRITGEGAKPLEPMPSTAEVLQLTRQLVAQTHGWDAYMLDGFRCLVVLADACEEFCEDLPDDWFPQVLDCTREQFESGELIE